MTKERRFPKLPDQDDYLLDLQNNNYSMQTVYNYARDLCIFALYVSMSGKEFAHVDKKDISRYKGYLRKGQHLVDLEKFREYAAKRALVTAINDPSSSKGPRTHETEGSGMNIPPVWSKNAQKDESTVSDLENAFPDEMSDEYLSDIYKKVFGNLGTTANRSNAKSNGEEGLDARSINRMLSALRSYLRFRIDFDLVTPIVPDQVKLIKTTQKKKQVAEFDELVKLIESPMEFESNTYVALRNRAMLEILFSTGMRISELINLDLEQINRDGKLFITGKGNKQRFVYLTDRSRKWLDKYLEIRLSSVGDLNLTDIEPGNLIIAGDPVDGNPGEKTYIDDVGREGETSGDFQDVSRGGATDIDSDDVTSSSNDESTIDRFNETHFKYIDLCVEYRNKGYFDKFYSPALFVPFSGGRNGKRGKRLSTNFFQEKIAEYRRRLGIQVPTSAHSLRHGFATYLAENGAPAAAIQVLLGHESLSTTTKYVHASDKFAQEVHKDKHPLD